jgi:cytochrome c peroxidase
VKAYTHNGFFKSLEQVVHFYNTRDVLKTCPKNFKGEIGVWCWPAPEVGDNVNRTELGNFGLSPREEAAIVAFLKTLSDD